MLAQISFDISVHGAHPHTAPGLAAPGMARRDQIRGAVASCPEASFRHHVGFLTVNYNNNRSEIIVVSLQCHC